MDLIDNAPITTYFEKYKNIVYIPNFKFGSFYFLPLFKNEYLNSSKCFYKKKENPDLIIASECDLGWVQDSLKRKEINGDSLATITNIKLFGNMRDHLSDTSIVNDESSSYKLGQIYIMDLYLNHNHKHIPLLLFLTPNNDCFNHFILKYNIRIKYATWNSYGCEAIDRDLYIKNLNKINSQFFIDNVSPSNDNFKELNNKYKCGFEYQSIIEESKSDYYSNLYQTDKVKKDASYSYNISDKLALGYGSKYQLLRMLGWHRQYLNKQISFLLEVNENIDWLDFTFSGSEDKEIMNADFLNEEIKKEWKKIWPTGNGKCGINWDAIGKSNDTTILLEAKAQINECGNEKDTGGGQSVEAIRDIFTSFQNKYHLEQIDWTSGDIYQIANRLIFLDFLKDKGINAKLVYVLFINGYEFNTKDGKNNSVHSKEEWEDKFNNLFIKMRIKDTVVSDMIHFCYIDCNQK